MIKAIDGVRGKEGSTQEGKIRSSKALTGWNEEAEFCSTDSGKSLKNYEQGTDVSFAFPLIGFLDNVY